MKDYRILVGPKLTNTSPSVRPGPDRPSTTLPRPSTTVERDTGKVGPSDDTGPLTQRKREEKKRVGEKGE